VLKTQIPQFAKAERPKLPCDGAILLSWNKIHAILGLDVKLKYDLYDSTGILLGRIIGKSTKTYGTKPEIICYIVYIDNKTKTQKTLGILDKTQEHYYACPQIKPRTCFGVICGVFGVGGKSKRRRNNRKKSKKTKRLRK
jgi:hypothetical protein